MKAVEAASAQAGRRVRMGRAKAICQGHLFIAAMMWGMVVRVIIASVSVIAQMVIVVT